MLPGLLGLSLAGFAQRPAGAEGAGRGGDVRPAATIAAVTQNLKKLDGFYSFYYDDKTGKIYLEIDRWNEEFLYFSSLPEGVGNGGAERGQASAVIAKFIRVGPKVFLLQPDYEHRSVNGSADEKKDVADGFSQSVLFGFAPVALEGDKARSILLPLSCGMFCISARRSDREEETRGALLPRRRRAGRVRRVAAIGWMTAGRRSLWTTQETFRRIRSSRHW